MNGTREHILFRLAGIEDAFSRVEEDSLSIS